MGSYITEGNSEYGDIDKFKQLGIIVKHRGTDSELVITPTQFKTLLSKGGFQDVNVVLKSLRDKGLLDCDEGKFTRKRKISKKLSSIRVHVIKVAAENVPEINRRPQNNTILENLFDD